MATHTVYDHHMPELSTRHNSKEKALEKARSFAKSYGNDLGSSTGSSGDIGKKRFTVRSLKEHEQSHWGK